VEFLQRCRNTSSSRVDAIKNSEDKEEVKKKEKKEDEDEEKEKETMNRAISMQLEST